MANEAARNPKGPTTPRKIALRCGIIGSAAFRACPWVETNPGGGSQSPPSGSVVFRCRGREADRLRGSLAAFVLPEAAWGELRMRARPRLLPSG